MGFVNIDNFYIDTSKIAYYYFEDTYNQVIVSFGGKDFLTIDISLEEFEKICFGKGEEYFYPPLG